MTKHTPTPIERKGLWWTDAEGKAILPTADFYRTGDYGESLRMKINAHDELVAALSDLLKGTQDSGWCNAPPTPSARKERAAKMNVARAILEKVKGDE